MNEQEGGSGDQILKQDRVGRVRTPKAKREALLEEYEKSGMSGVEFAAWAGVKYPTFAGWLQKQRQRQPVSSKATEVKWLEAEVPQPEAKAQGTLVAHLPGGVRVEGSGRDLAQLLALLGVGRC